MTEMKSEPYKLNGKLFRYNFDTCTVEYIQRADRETKEADAEWKRTHGGRSLYGVGEDGYIVLDTIGLSRENWADKEARDSYLSGWCNDLDEELSSMAADFVKYELPYLM